MRWVFDEFELDAGRYRLTRSGREVHVEPRVIEALAHLVEHRHRVVSKDELVEEVWSGAHVTDATLKRAIQEARRALGDDGERQEVIETVYGRGYRFVRETREMEGAAAAGDSGVPVGGEHLGGGSERLGVPRVPRWVGFGLLGLLMLAVAVGLLGLLLYRTERPRSAARTTPDRTTLAVLPFQYLGPSDGSHIAAGLGEEITTRLAAEPGLRVLSHTRAEGYTDGGKSPLRLGTELGAQYVLEGSVRWKEGTEGGRVVVAPRLVHTRDGALVWAESIERELEDLFDVQEEIAEGVTRGLHGVAPGSGSWATARAPVLPVGSEAYEAYLEGLHLARLFSHDPEEPRRAADAFERAVALEPEFARAWAELAIVRSRLCSPSGAARHHDREDAAEQAARVVVHLQPDLPRTPLARGYYHFYCEEDYQRASTEFEEAVRRLPSSPAAYGALAFSSRSLGRWREAVEHYREAVRLDPLSYPLNTALAVTLIKLHRYREAIRLARRATTLEPRSPNGYIAHANAVVLSTGDAEAALEILNGSPTSSRGLTSGLLQMHLVNRDAEAVLELADRFESSFQFDVYVPLPPALAAAWAYEILGREGPAREAFRRARRVLEEWVREKRETPEAHAALGLALAGLDLHGQAIEEGRRAVTLVPASQAHRRAVFPLPALAAIYARAGRSEEAIDLLEELLSRPSHISPARLRVDPLFDPLRDEPRFRQLVSGTAGASSPVLTPSTVPVLPDARSARTALGGP